MSNLFTWQVHGDGKTLKPGEVVEPDERLTWPRTAEIGAQHVIAMFGATFLVPILTGFDPSTTLFFTAMSTALFLLINKNVLPSYLGSSFASLAPIHRRHHGEQGHRRRILRHSRHWFAAGSDRCTRALRGCQVDRHHHAAGRQRRHRGHHRLQPGSERVEQLQSRSRHRHRHPRRGAARRSAVQGSARPTQHPHRRDHRLRVRLLPWPGRLLSHRQGAWVGLPEFRLPQVDFTILPMFIPVVLVLVAENVGHVKSVSQMTGRDYDDQIGTALFADGLGTTIAGFGGGSGTTTYGENIGVMAATKVYSTAAYWCAAAFALILSLCPKFGAIINTIPAGVLGGVTTLLYGMIGMVGIRIWVENKVNFDKPLNIMVAAITMIIAIGQFAFAFNGISFNGIAIGTIVILIAYHGLKAIGKATGTIDKNDPDIL